MRRVNSSTIFVVQRNSNRFTRENLISALLNTLVCAPLVIHCILGIVDECRGADFLSRPGFPGAIISDDGTRVGWYVQESGEWQVTDILGNEVWKLMPTTGGDLVLDGSGVRAVKGNELWYETGEMQELEGSAFDISADGQSVVGSIFGESGDYDDREAFLWTEDDGMTSLPPLPGFRGSEAKAISADGRVTAGQSLRTEDPFNVSTTERGATIWTSNDAGGFEAIGLGRPRGEDTDARLISTDGLVVAGVSRLDMGGPLLPVDRAFRWTEEKGIFKLDLLDGTTDSYPRGITSDGSIIVGEGFWFVGGQGRPFVWDTIHGTRDLKQVLFEEHGIRPDVFPPELETGPRVNGISGDGRVVGGFYELGDEKIGWLAVLDRPLVVTSGVAGDFNGNAALDIEDLDLLAGELMSDRNVELFDVNVDGSVDSSDRQFWVHELAHTFFGDANLDGEFNSNDLVAVFEAGEYEDNLAANSGWRKGDWNGDAEFNSSDLVLAFQDSGYEQGPRGAVNSVPEPASLCLLTFGFMLVARWIKQDGL
jgi:uncharacterized membrane protein